LIEQLTVPARAVGGFFEMMIDTGRELFRRPLQFREFLDQTWMIARVSLVPTLLVSIPFTVLVAFTLNILLREIGAADLSGAGTAFGTITQLGPVVTVLVVAGALLTPDYRQEFQKSANAQIIPEAKKREVVVQANVVGVGVMSAKRTSASVMVYMNRTVTDKSRQPLYDGSRLRVDFKKIGKQWLIAYITPI
jgi:uncharacterized membrane protein (DUF485 family)